MAIRAQTLRAASLLVLAMLFPLFGCEKSENADIAAEQAAPEPAPAARQFQLKKVGLVTGHSEDDSAPVKAAELENLVEKRLRSSPATGDEGTEIAVALSYEIQPSTSPMGGEPTTSAAVSASVGGDDIQISAREIVYGTEFEGEKSAGDLVKIAGERVAEQLASHLQVYAGSADEIARLIQDEKTEAPVRLAAVQQLREREAKNHAKVIREVLDAETPELRVAASRALVDLGDEQSYSRIIEVAAQLSRDRNPQYVPMLYVIADMGTREAVTYLETVADAHAAPAVRKIATEALSKAKKPSTPKEATR